MDIHTIKLIIWDLDDTFWSGTLTEGGATPIERNMQLVRVATDCGIINSICSRNDFQSTVNYLQEIDIWDYFVFASINWENKAQRIKQQIDDMALRSQNVLFIDDNQFNLQEVKHYLPDIQIATPDKIEHLWASVQQLKPTDKSHKRLKQYKVLEAKAKEKKHFDSNEEFLWASNIRATILYDCQKELARLHDLILRSNQLNYTKKRITQEELRELLDAPTYNCGYVKVEDRFGDYGIVGFYALKNDVLEHFVFSCRTMGQLIEQWVYAQLGFPQLEVVGEVRTILNSYDIPAWINHNSVCIEDKEKKYISSCKILLKGPCDLSHSKSYIKQVGQIDTEFTYVANDGRIIDAYNHSSYIIGAHEYSQTDKEQILKDCPFVDAHMLDSKFFTGNYDIIFLSSLIESVYGIYQRKDSHIRVVFSSKDKPLTDSHNWDDYIGGKIYNCNNLFSIETLQTFANQYTFKGATTPEDYTSFLQKVIKWLPEKTTLCIILGTTFPHANHIEWAESHRRLNEVVIALSQKEPRLRYISLDEIIHSDSDFTDDSLNHYSARVYYEIAQKMLAIITEETGVSTKSYSHLIIWFDNLLYACKKVFKKHVSTKSRLYRLLKPLYSIIARK